MHPRNPRPDHRGTGVPGDDVWTVLLHRPEGIRPIGRARSYGSMRRLLAAVLRARALETQESPQLSEHFRLASFRVRELTEGSAFEWTDFDATERYEFALTDERDSEIGTGRSGRRRIIRSLPARTPPPSSDPEGAEHGTSPDRDDVGDVFGEPVNVSPPDP